jgi:1,2-diacylglycerol 3-alpha-glucosyltransferase
VDLKLLEYVVFVCMTYYPRVTGVGVVVEGWSRRLAEFGIHPIILAPEHPPTPYYPQHEPPPEAEVLRLPSKPVPFAPGLRTMQAAGPIWEALVNKLKGRNTLVHAQDPLAAGRIALQLSKATKAPLIVHVHSPVFGTEARDWLPGLVGAIAQPLLHNAARRAVSSLCLHADAVLAVTDFVADLFDARGIPRPRVLPCGIEKPIPPNANTDIRRAHSIPKDAPLLLYVGRLDPDKGIAELFLAFRYILQEEPHAVLLLVGGGPFQPSYQKTARRLGIAQRVVFAGWCQHRDVWQYYRQADLFIIANRDEAQGLVALEAQACGLPVVGYRTGGIGLMVADGLTGILASPDSKNLAAAAVELLRNEKLRRKLGAAGPSRAAAFSADENFNQLLNIYREVLSKNRDAGKL